MPLPSPPLDTPHDVMAALGWLRRFSREDWPRILGAAVAYDLIPPARARELLMEAKGALPPPWWCTACNGSQAITCNWCGADACATCWRCMTPGCGEDMPKRRKGKQVTAPKVVTGRRGLQADVVTNFGEAVTFPAGASLYLSSDGQEWDLIGTTDDTVRFTNGSQRS